MGALTNKSFPFEVREWDIKKFESIDLTDGFGTNIKIYISKKQIVLIEPENTYNNWINDKSRHFFDGIFWPNLPKISPNDFWKIINKIIKNLFIFDHCNQHYYQKKFVTIVFENLSLEVLNLLLIFYQNYSFVTLKRSEKFKINNDLETLVKLNIASDNVKLNFSTLYLLISNNPRYEGSFLNLNLRKRFLKGNITCFILGSLIDLTFSIRYLGTNIIMLSSITEGTSLFCQNFKAAQNPLVIYNTELCKRNDGNYTLDILKILNYFNYSFNKTWNSLNMLNSSLSETGNHFLTNFLPLTLKDLNNFSLLYFINIPENNISNIKKITELKLLNYSLPEKKKIINFDLITMLLDQNFQFNNNFIFTDKLNINSYYYLPISIFYDSEETFINTEGCVKRSTKLLPRNKRRNNWQILRKIIKCLKKNFIELNNKNNELLFFNSTRVINFKNFINFQYYANKNLTYFNFYLINKTNSFIFNNKFSNFKISKKKIKNTKLKYWLDDFFENGKDDFIRSSNILHNCSRNIRLTVTNFF